MKTINSLALAFTGALSLSGCATVAERCHPITELSHTSHALQHIGPNRTNYGWNVASVGAICRPDDGLTITVLEGYTPERLDGQHEVFQARVTWEFKP